MDSMPRRAFVQMPAVVAAADLANLPRYRAVSPYPAGPEPNRFPARVATSKVDENEASVRQAISATLRALTGAANDRDAWATFVQPADVVGVKVNCSGAPKILSHPLIVGEIARQLTLSGVAPQNIYVFERFANQMVTANYTPHLPAGAQIHAMEDGTRRGGISNYDQRAYVETDFFGEEQTRSFLSKLVTRTLTKIVNVPNMKDHGAAGVTGCLKNLAYGSFSNVARSHRDSRTHTLSFIGELYRLEPLRSKSVLHVMDGIRGVWQGGPFVKDDRYLFEPRLLMAGTDPVAMDRLLIDVIENKRREMGAVSVWDRSPAALKDGAYFREPGHIEFASKLGLGVYDRARIAEIRA